jgi:hypothetical protein
MRWWQGDLFSPQVAQQTVKRQETPRAAINARPGPCTFISALYATLTFAAIVEV